MNDAKNNDNTKNRCDSTKGKIVIFAIGVLVGAIISGAAFLISVNVLGQNRIRLGRNESMQLPAQGEMPQGMPGGRNNFNGQRPDMMGDHNNQNNTTPETPSNS